MNVDFATKEDIEELKAVILNAIAGIGKSKASKSDVFTAKEAADYVKMSVYMLRIKAAAGEIAYTKDGKSYKFRRCDLDDYIERTRVMTSAEAESMVLTGRRKN